MFLGRFKRQKYVKESRNLLNELWVYLRVFSDTVKLMLKSVTVQYGTEKLRTANITGKKYLLRHALDNFLVGAS